MLPQQPMNAEVARLPEQQEQGQDHRKEPEASLAVDQVTSSESSPDTKSSTHHEVDKMDSAAHGQDKKDTVLHNRETETETAMDGSKVRTQADKQSAEQMQSGGEQPSADLKSEAGNGDPAPSLHLTPKSSPGIPSDPVPKSKSEAETQEARHQLDQKNSKDEKKMISSAEKSNRSHDSRTDDNVDTKDVGKEVGEEKGGNVKQAGESARGPSTGKPAGSSAAGSNGQTSSRPQPRGTSPWTNSAAVKTQRRATGTSHLMNSRPNKENSPRETDQKTLRTVPSNASKSPRSKELKTPLKTIEKIILKKNDKAQVHALGSVAKSNSLKKADSKDTKQDSKDINPNQTTAPREPEQHLTIENETSGDSIKHPSTHMKSANGVLHKHVSESTENGRKDNLTQGNITDQEKKAHLLLNKALLTRRAANMKSKSDHSNFSQPNNMEVKRGPVDNNEEEKSTSPHSSSSGPDDKHQTMQSLAVPSKPLGPVPSELDETASLSSRRDSVRMSMDSTSRKSVDFRVSAMQSVVAAAGVEEKPKSMLMHDDAIRAAIPFLPVRLAVVCLVLNIVLPGSGTVISGFSVLCGAECRLPSKGDAKAMTLCLNLVVGLFQLATVIFLMVGWFWSLAWGVKMVILAVEHQKEKKQQRQKELQALALRAFTSPIRHNSRRSLPPPV